MYWFMLQYEAILFCCLVAAAYHRKEDMESVFPNRAKPGLHDRLKLWWAKEVTPDYHVAGRLSERQIKYASEGGFKSVLSLFEYDESGDFGGDYLPTTKETEEIAREQCGMEFAVVLSHDEDWRNADAVKKLGDVLSKLKKPVLLYSDRGHAVTFVLLMHLANLTRQDPSFEPKIDSNTFYKMTAVMAMDFTKDSTKKVVSEITGEPVVEDPPVTNAEPEGWLNYWLVHPVYKNWYTSGQITKSQINVMGTAGFKSVINMRTGKIFEGEPDQEEVNLLNIRERTGTYATDKTLPRQSKERLEETRVDPNKPNNYISSESNVNYESKNEVEFGDDIGFNEDLEGKAFTNSTVEYHHYPAGSDGPWEPYFDTNLVKLVEIGKRGPVLVQCARAARAAYLAILGAAVEHNLDFNWALMKSRDLGFTITEKKTPEIYKTMKKFIDKE